MGCWNLANLSRHWEEMTAWNKNELYCICNLSWYEFQCGLHEVSVLAETSLEDIVGGVLCHSWWCVAVVLIYGLDCGEFLGGTADLAVMLGVLRSLNVSLKYAASHITWHLVKVKWGMWCLGWLCKEGKLIHPPWSLWSGTNPWNPSLSK